MAVKRDLYLILGVPPIASADTIRKSFRQLSKKYHPDLNLDMKIFSDEKMKELVDAYGILSDPEKRKDYDKQPIFHVKKFRKGMKKGQSKADPAAYTRKPKYESESSLLERILSPFLKKKDKDGQGTVKVDLKQSDVHFTLALTMADNESFFEQAKNEFRIALKYDPTCAEALYNIGLMCYKMGEFDEARVNFQKYLSHEKEDAYAKKLINMLRDDF
jgi:DnaJ-class molecular chaperone